MAQACDKYTKHSLMGNWYEERLAPQQNQRGPNITKSVRPVEEGISIPGEQGKIIPLPRVGRNPHWITKDLIPDDGFREFRSLQGTSYDPKNIQNMFELKDCRPIIKTNGQRVMYPECNPTVAQTGGSTNYKMLTAANMHQTDIKREIPASIIEYGSSLKPPSKPQFYGVTQYNASFQAQKGTTLLDIKSKDKFHPAGCNEREEGKQGLKMTSVLIGEKFRNQNEPKDNTGVQRSWLPQSDPGLIAASENLKRNSTALAQSSDRPFNDLQTYKQNNSQILPFDNATSLPLGVGMYTQQRQSNEPGAFRHVRTDVTIIRNKPLTKK